MAGLFRKVPGILWHSTRSGVRRTTWNEFEAIRAYARRGADGKGWQVTVGNTYYSVHMGPKAWGWHAYSDSDDYIAIELVQSMPDQPITDAQLDTAFHYLRTEAVPAWDGRLDLATFKFHSTSPEGIRTGSTDPFPRGSRELADLERRIRERL